MKKTVSIILTMIMLLSLSATVFADKTDLTLTELLDISQGNIKEVRFVYNGAEKLVTFENMLEKFLISCNEIKLEKQSNEEYSENPVKGLFIEVFKDDNSVSYAYISNEGYVDKYSMAMSRLPAKSYKINNFNESDVIKKLFALGNGKSIKFSDWAKEYVFMAEQNEICDFEDYTLPTTRLEFCEMLYTAMIQTKAPYPTLTEKENKFIDCDNEAVKYFYELGVINGTSENEFSPNSKIYREEVAAIVYRLAKKLNFQGFYDDYRLSSYMFIDTEKMSDWAVEAISQLKTAGIMDGIGGDTFAPKAIFTREQAVALTIKLFIVILENEKPSVTPSDVRIVSIMKSANNDKVIAELKEKYGENIEVIELPDNAFLEKTNLIIAAGEPCIIVGTFNEEFLKKLDEQKIKWGKLSNDFVYIENNLKTSVIGVTDKPTNIFIGEEFNTALKYINISNLSDDFRSFVEKESLVLTNEMCSFAKNQKYVELYTGDGDIRAEIKMIASVDYKTPKNIICIEPNEDSIGKITGLNVDKEILKIIKKKFTGVTVGNMINARNGVKTISAATVLTGSKGYVMPKNFKNTTVVLDFEGDYVSVVSFNAFGDGVISANSLFVKDPNNEIRDLLQQLKTR